MTNSESIISASLLAFDWSASISLMTAPQDAAREIRKHAGIESGLAKMSAAEIPTTMWVFLSTCTTSYDLAEDDNQKLLIGKVSPNILQYS